MMRFDLKTNQKESYFQQKMKFLMMNIRFRRTVRLDAAPVGSLPVEEIDTEDDLGDDDDEEDDDEVDDDDAVG